MDVMVQVPRRFYGLERGYTLAKEVLLLMGYTYARNVNMPEEGHKFIVHFQFEGVE